MKDNKIMVNVYQQKENKKKELVNVLEDEKQNILQLAGFLYQKAILKSNNIKIKYSYNYNDVQNITFINSYENYDGTISKTYYEFLNIPTKLGYLDIYKLIYKLEKDMECER